MVSGAAARSRTIASIQEPGESRRAHSFGPSHKIKVYVYRYGALEECSTMRSKEIDMPQSVDTDRRAIDELTGAFFRAFTNRSGTLPNVDSLYELFIPEAIIIKNVGGTPVVYDVKSFVEPRRSLLTDGSLVDFCEKETSERTEIFGNIAQRFSCYTKTWTAQDKSFAGGGTKSIQFVRTRAGWKIASLVWDDN